MSKILILMSTYNGEKYLREQIESIRNQTIKEDIEILVRDDGSKDGTLEILEEYAEIGTLQFIRGKNIGSAQSFHELLRIAPKYDYYAFADQDDFWLPKKIERALEWLKKRDKPALYGCYKKIVDMNLKPLSINDVAPKYGFLNTLFSNNVVSGCTMVFNNFLREKYLACNEIDREIFHDSYLWKLCVMLGDVYYDYNSYILYRQHGNNTIGYSKTGYLMFFEKIKRMLFQNGYKTNRRLSKLAAAWVNSYSYEIEPSKLKVLKELSMANKSILMRYRLLLEPGLSFFPIYEYLGTKVRIALGWL